MVSKLTKVTNEMGFHMRPANVFVTAMTNIHQILILLSAIKKSTAKAL